MKTPPTPIKVVVVGAGRGSGYIDAIRSAGDRAFLAGVFDPVPEASAAFAREYGVPAQYEKFEQAVEAADAVILSSPQHFHAPQAAYALRAGVHVLSEVPAAVSLEQAYQLLAEARQSSATYMLAENYGYTRNNLIVRAMAHAGEFGELYLGEGEYIHEMKGYHSDSNGPTWRRRWQVGRNGHTYPTHSLGPVLDWMQDRIVAVSCVGTGNWTTPDYEQDDSVMLLGRTRRGALIRSRLDLVSNRPTLMDYYSLQGTVGAFESGRGMDDTPRVHISGGDAHPQWRPLESYAQRFLPERYLNPPEGAGHWGSDAWPFLEFLEAVETGQTPPIDIHKALEMTLPGILSEVSIAQNGQWVFVPDPRTMTAGIGLDPDLSGRP